MVISYYGAGMVKVAQGDTVAVFNPNGKSRFGSDLVLVSANDEDYNASDTMSRGERVPFVVNGPGEYEVGGIFIKGFASEASDGKINTVYSMVLEGVNLVHLGALAQADLLAAKIEELGIIDVLFVPVGNSPLPSKAVAKLATNLSPRLVIPVDYKNDDELKTFLKEFGAEKSEAVESLALKKKDLLDKEGAVAIIKSF